MCGITVESWYQFYSNRGNSTFVSLQEADHQIQLLSNDLFRLEDKLDHVFSIDNLHNIRLAE